MFRYRDNDRLERAVSSAFTCFTAAAASTTAFGFLVRSIGGASSSVTTTSFGGCSAFATDWSNVEFGAGLGSLSRSFFCVGRRFLFWFRLIGIICRFFYRGFCLEGSGLAVSVLSVSVFAGSDSAGGVAGCSGSFVSGLGDWSTAFVSATTGVSVGFWSVATGVSDVAGAFVSVSFTGSFNVLFSTGTARRRRFCCRRSGRFRSRGGFRLHLVGFFLRRARYFGNTTGTVEGSTCGFIFSGSILPASDRHDGFCRIDGNAFWNRDFSLRRFGGSGHSGFWRRFRGDGRRCAGCCGGLRR